MKIIGLTNDSQLNDTVMEGVIKFLEIAGLRSSRPLAAYFCVASVPGQGRALMIREIGSCPEEKARKYFEFCQEKKDRLYKNPGHISSWQSRQPEKDKYGGAVRTALDGYYILSMSGLPEHGDEAVMVYTAHKINWMNKDTILAIIGISKNPYIAQMLTP